MVDPTTRTLRLWLTLASIIRRSQEGTWNQRSYLSFRSEGLGCGTAYCFAGDAAKRAYPEMQPLDFHSCYDDWQETSLFLCRSGQRNVKEVAREWLGLTSHEAERLFSSGNGLETLRRVVRDLAGPAPAFAPGPCAWALRGEAQP